MTKDIVISSGVIEHLSVEEVALIRSIIDRGVSRKNWQAHAKNTRIVCEPTLEQMVSICLPTI